MPKGQMVSHVMIMVYAVVKQISSMTNVMHVILAFLTFRHVKVTLWDKMHNMAKSRLKIQHFQLVSNPKNPFWMFNLLRKTVTKTLVYIKKSQKRVSNLGPNWRKFLVFPFLLHKNLGENLKKKILFTVGPIWADFFDENQ